MARKETYRQNSGMVLVVSYFVLFAVNSAVVFFASLLFPGLVVLGTEHITVFWALVHAMGTLALLDAFAIPFIREQEKLQGKMFTTRDWMVAYFFLNFVGLWVLSRFAEQMGFGISSWLVAAGLAVVLDVFQGIAMMQVEKLRVREKRP